MVVLTPRYAYIRTVVALLLTGLETHNRIMRAGRWSFEQILSVLNHSSLLETKAIPFDSDMLKAAFSGGGV